MSRIRNLRTGGLLYFSCFRLTPFHDILNTSTDALKIFLCQAIELWNDGLYLSTTLTKDLPLDIAQISPCFA